MDREDILVLIENTKKRKKTKLDLSNRDIAELPEEIGELTDLKVLILSYNSIEMLPSSIGYLVNLEELRLHKNKLSELPEEIGKLKKLQLIDLSNNYFTTFPEKIGEMHNLQSLDASYCKLATLPNSMTQLLSLRELSLEGNAFIYPPGKIIKRGLYATMHFLSQEKRKKELSEVVVQVLNLPENIQLHFNKYIEGFFEILLKSEISTGFVIKYINQDTICKEIPYSTIPNIEKELNKVSDLISSKTNKIKQPDSKIALIGELKTQLNVMNERLVESVNNSTEMHSKIEELSKKIDLLKNK